MRQFNYTIKEPIGIHARPAGLLAKAVKVLDSTVTIEKAGSEPVLANRLMALMGLGVKCGDTRKETSEHWSVFLRNICEVNGNGNLAKAGMRNF